jgi:hypothetical protein
MYLEKFVLVGRAHSFDLTYAITVVADDSRLKRLFEFQPVDLIKIMKTKIV